jgi:hypothetical protein
MRSESVASQSVLVVLCRRKRSGGGRKPSLQSVVDEDVSIITKAQQRPSTHPALHLAKRRRRKRSRKMKSFCVICLTFFSTGSAVSGFVAPTIPSLSMPMASAKPNTFVVGSTTEALYTEEITTIAESECESGGSILDESSMLASQNFPISPQLLVEKAKAALIKDSGVLDPSLWAENFEFCAPYVGPLSKAEFLDAADGLSLSGF